MKPKRLGRGLSGLIKSSEPKTLPPSRTEPPAAPTDTPAPGSAAGAPVAQPVAPGIRELPVDEIQPNPFQPRSEFAEDDLEELKASIAEHGVLQPVVVRRGGVAFELIAGERRLRAVKALGWSSIPALVRPAEDEEMQTLALVENLQRVDLNAIEKAKALKAMMRNFGLTQDEVAARVGKARTSISNLVRLLDLPGVIQDLVTSGQLSGSQARAVLLAHGTERRIALAQRAARDGLTVRKIEALAKAERSGEMDEKPEDPYVKDLEVRMQQALGTRVQLKPRGRGGSITIGYHDANELDRLLELFGAG
ncbi:MAG: ParB/RepB/Spo0J family partition protein [Planctomycetota bacterium]|nr:ParB/RepB/Spo0J family partition protein [Planctomycetota bacterium]